MKKAYLSFIAAASLLIVSCGEGEKKEDKKDNKKSEKKEGKKEEKKAKKVSYTVDTSATTLTWHGTHTVKEKKHHIGTVKVTDGILTMKGDKVSSGNFTINLTTIENKDLEDEKMSTKLVKHLMSPDFFNVEKHTVATLSLDGQKDGAIQGTLNAVGTTMKVSIPVKPTVKGDQLKAKGSFTVDFSKAKMKGMQPEEGKEDKGHVSNKVTFDLNLVMNKS